MNMTSLFVQYSSFIEHEYQVQHATTSINAVCFSLHIFIVMFNLQFGDPIYLTQNIDCIFWRHLKEKIKTFYIPYF